MSFLPLVWKLRDQWLASRGNRSARRESSRKTRRPKLPLSVELLECRLAPASRIWTGGGAGNYAWTNPNNWNSGATLGAPHAGDDLVFAAGVPAASLSTNNDMNADTAFNSITIQGSGYTLGGNEVL